MHDSLQVLGTDKIETAVAQLYFEDDVLHIVFKKDAVVELEHIEEIITLRKKNQKGKKVLTLVDSGQLWRVEKEARERAASRDMIDNNIALAIVSNNLAQRLIANFYMKVDKPDVPTKMFNNYQDAIAWLKQFEDA
jgi:hypothetical protein